MNGNFNFFPKILSVKMNGNFNFFPEKGHSKILSRKIFFVPPKLSARSPPVVSAKFMKDVMTNRIFRTDFQPLNYLKQDNKTCN